MGDKIVFRGSLMSGSERRYECELYAFGECLGLIFILANSPHRRCDIALVGVECIVLQSKTTLLACRDLGDQG